ncbi:MAG: hypothetical protein ACJAWG_002590, partial [Candidatus Azotimanducaceae bacterium]
MTGVESIVGRLSLHVLHEIQSFPATVASVLNH